MRTTIIPLFFMVILSGFSPKPVKVIHIQPLGNVDDSVIIHVKNNIEKFYNYKCLINKQIPLSNGMLAKSNTRYDALKILNRFNNKQNILIITEKDIATKLRGYDEYGILGLGFRPGTTCVISTYRMKKNVSKEKFYDRLAKVSIHEVGHNLGIDHCIHSKKCIMNDLHGKISTLDKNKIHFCNKCKSML